MKRPSVFLSKSNAGNDEAYRLVKRALEQEGVRVVEYTPGAYDIQQVLDCDRLVIIPQELVPNRLVSRALYLGKGQYEQLDQWADKYGYMEELNPIIIAEVRESNGKITTEVTEYHTIIKTERNWTTNYAKIGVDNSATCCLADCWDDWARHYRKYGLDDKEFTTGFTPLIIDHCNLIKGTSGNGEEVGLKDIERMFYDPATYNVTVYKWNVNTEGWVRPMLCLAA